MIQRRAKQHIQPIAARAAQRIADEIGDIAAVQLSDRKQLHQLDAQRTAQTQQHRAGKALFIDERNQDAQGHHHEHIEEEFTQRSRHDEG